MPTLKITNRKGQTAQVQARSGRTLMEILRDRNEVEALCGGQAACATCHVHIAPEWLAVVGEASELEADLLDASLEGRQDSRLSCQVVLSDAMDGLGLTVAQAE